MNWKRTWFLYDMGNSAHFLIIITICFPLFFKNFLFSGYAHVESLWSIVTMLILIFSAVLSPLISGYAYAQGNRVKFFSWLTMLCILTTLFLAFPFSSPKVVLLFYILSVITHYLCLPLYNSFLSAFPTQDAQKTSAWGWGLGYLGGILVALISLALGLLNYSPNEQPQLFSLNFLLAWAFLIVFTLPLLFSLRKLPPKREKSASSYGFFPLAKYIFSNKPILKLLLTYWLIGEVAAIGIYFFAFYMNTYLHFAPSKILGLSLAIQFIGIFSTIFSGYLVSKYGVKKIILALIALWVLVPIALFSISIGFSYWIVVAIIGLVVGSYHAILRGELSKRVEALENNAYKGGLWGFFDTTGRISQIFSLLLVFIVLQFSSLNYAVLSTIIFPLIAFFVIKNYENVDKIV